MGGILVKFKGEWNEYHLFVGHVELLCKYYNLLKCFFFYYRVIFFIYQNLVVCVS